MKKLLVLLLSGMIVFALPSCGGGATSRPAAGSNSSGTAAASSQSGNSMQNASSQSQTNIVIQPPSGWERVQGSVLQVHYLKGTASFMVKEEPAFTSKTLDGIVGEAKKKFEAAFKNVSYAGDVKTVSVDGKDARAFIFTCKVSSLNMKYEYVYLLAGGKTFAITFGDMEDQFDSLSADYAQILKDIRFQ